ncbi:MAG: hypothetical protein J2P59_04170 [Acidimicrobiales bacterium]|nr:hypothetical protein [Acidimicrobiales bacterium]
MPPVVYWHVPKNGPEAWSPAVVAAVAARPWLWWVAGRQALRLAEPGWWRRWPPVPRPARGYLAFRLECATGDANRDADPKEVVSYLEWCRRGAVWLR